MRDVLTVQERLRAVLRTLCLRDGLRILLYSAFGLVLLGTSIFTERASAANFQMQTGYYVGSGVAGLSISGVGFQPDFVMIKSATTAGAAVIKTSAMPANAVAFTSATADNTGANITLTTTGFSVGTLANVNSANVLYHWVAVGGSDCSATGNFCVGSYTGNGTATRDLTVGFSPEMVIAKRSTAVAGHFRVNSEPANETLFLNTNARDTAGNYIRSFGATSFQVGAIDNVNTGVYYYAAFSTTANAFSEGTYTGNGVDNRSITGLGYRPNFALVKNATSVTANNLRPLMTTRENHGDYASFVGDVVADSVNGIQALESDGFQVGTSGSVNENTTTMYWFAFGGASAYTSSGSFSMKTGVYTGNGVSQGITGLGFRPQLVIVTGASGTTVFRTEMMKGDSTAYTASATANFTGGVTSLDADGFTVGAATQTNSNAVVYHWQAFAGAYNPYTNSGANDFAIGAYYGNGIDNRDVERMPWQPDMVAVKRNGATAGTWRSSAQAGDLSAFFAATAEAANNVQVLNIDGFQVGTGANVNTAANLYHWFAFKNGSQFMTGSYTGTGVSQSITSAGFRAENVWVKRSTAVNGVHRSVALSGGSSQYFAAVANASDRITDFVKGGFRVGGAQTETNTNAGTYRYAAWNDTSYGSLGLDIVDAAGASVATPSFAMNNIAYSFSCSSVSGSLGAVAQKVRISNLTTNAAWSVSIAPTSGATDRWRNGGNTQRYDFNDSGGAPSGCSDGADADAEAGQLTINPAVGTITHEAGCTATNVSLGSQAAYVEGSINSIGLLSASAGANSDCIWDIIGLGLTQTVPAEQSVDSYGINMTITVVAN